MFRKMKLGTKLMTAFLVVGLIPFAIVAIISLTKSNSALSKQVFGQLESMREVKQNQIKDMYAGMQGDMRVLLETVKTLRREAFEKLKSVQHIKKAQIEDFFARVQKDITILAGSEDAHKLYKLLRQYQIDEEIEASDSFLTDTYEYEEIWKESGRTLLDYVKVYGYSDALIISADHGHVMYSAAKNADLGANLKSKAFKDQSLAKLWEKVVATKQVQIQDFKPYAPANGAPLAFIGAPVQDLSGTLQAVAVLRISLDAVNKVMQQREGLGQTGETYLVGADMLMRSDSLLDPEHHSVKASFNNPDKGKVDTLASQNALAGKHGQGVIIGYLGQPVLSSYSPLEIKGVKWAIIAEIDVAEAFSPVDEQGNEFFADYAKTYGYFDLLLLNPNGYCFYSAAKSADYQSNLVDGPFADSGLGRLVKKVLGSQKFGFADIAPYAPRNGDPAAFMAQPLTNDGHVEVVVAVQISLDAINRIMMERTGMGETGETYLVGQDKLMRSDSYLDKANRTVKASFADPSKGSVDTEAVREALSGKTAQKIITNMNGDSVLSSYTPLSMGDVTWALIAEIDKAEAFTTVDMMRWIVGLIAVIGIVAIALMAFGITRSITKPINQIIDGLNGSAEQVSSASGQVSVSSRQLAEGASGQAASIEESSSSLEEMAAMTKQNADNADEADNLMQQTNQVVSKADANMNELIESMGEISNASQETSKIVKTIDEIAFQTNLLALNAAVEAARAGESGAGFAVVADEVRNLAMRAAEAAKNTAQLIEGTVLKVEAGSELMNRTNDAFTQVADSASKMGELVAEIAAASKEQAQGIEQVNKAVTEMDKVTQRNAANAEESASAGEEMSAQAGQLMEMVNRLMALVGAKMKNINQQPASENRPRQAPPARAKKPEIEGKRNAEITPEKLIPLDSEDFQDF